MFRSLAIAVCLVAVLISGCVQPEAAPPSSTTAPTVTITWEPADPVAEQPVRFSVATDETTQGVQAASWDFGDGTGAQGLTPDKTYNDPGTYVVSVQIVTTSGDAQTADEQIVVDPGQEPQGSDGSSQPSSDPDPEGDPDPPTSGNETDEPEGNETDEPPQQTPPEPEAPQPPEWGAPAGKGLRPGINMVSDGASCTTSFLFTEDWTRYFISTAAHCVADGSSTDTDGCTAPLRALDSPSTLDLDNGARLTVPLTYSSWNMMQSMGGSDAGACNGNDFALLEIPAAALATAHPASLHFQAPTGLATSPTSEVWGYGASSLKMGVSEAHPKQGTHLGTSNGGWSHVVYLATPGIPGDSGGHIMTSDGKALGVASTILLAPYPGANHYTDIAKAVAFAEETTGMDLELITWDDFNASLA